MPRTAQHIDWGAEMGGTGPVSRTPGVKLVVFRRNRRIAPWWIRSGRGIKDQTHGPRSGGEQAW